MVVDEVTKETLPEVLKILLDKITSKDIHTLQDAIKSKLGEQDPIYQECLDILNPNIDTHVKVEEDLVEENLVEENLKQGGALRRVVAGLGVLGCQYFMVTNPLCYAYIMGANFLGHVTSASTSNDYKHANRAVFRGCTSTLLMISLLYGGVSLAPMAGVLAVYEIVFNQIGLSDGIADTLRINDLMQDARSHVGECLKACQKQIDKMASEGIQALLDIIKNKLEGQELSYIVEQISQQDDTLIRVVAGLGALGCQYFMVTNPLCYAGIIGANALGHAISASISNDYKHANRTAFRGCTSTLLMLGLLYGRVSLAPMAGVLAVYEIVFNQIGLSDGIADTLKLNNHIQDVLHPYVGEYLNL